MQKYITDFNVGTLASPLACVYHSELHKTPLFHLGQAISLKGHTPKLLLIVTAQ